MIEPASGYREAQRLEGSRFAVRQLYQTLAGGSRERPTATLLPKAHFPSTVNPRRGQTPAFSFEDEDDDEYDDD
jgi:hypothetical protein